MIIESQHYSQTTDTKIKFQEQGRSIVFNNPLRKPCFKITVDGGVFADSEEIRCDYLLVVSKNKPRIDSREQEHFIELKGVDVKHAICQLSATIPQLLSECAIRKAYVICKSVSPFLTAHIQKQKAYFKQNWQCDLIIKEFINPTL